MSIVGWLTLTGPRGSGSVPAVVPSAPERTNNQSPPESTGADLKNITRFDDTIWDIAYDPTRDALWVADLTDFGGRVLRVDAVSGATTAWTLPDASNLNPGVFSRIVVDGSGNVWVASNYNLLRLDPKTGVVATRQLDLKAPNMLAGADDLTSTDAGTWISAVAALDDGIVVARHNVPSLEAYDGSLQGRRFLDLPDSFEGSWGIVPLAPGGVLFLASAERGGGIGTFDSSGRLLATTQADAIGVVDGNGAMVLVGRNDSGRLVDITGHLGPQLDATVKNGDYSLAYPNALGGIDVYHDNAATVTRSMGGTIVASLVLPKHLVGDMMPIPIIPGSSAADSQGPAIEVPERITAMASDRHCVIWYVVAGSNALVRLSFQAHP